ncbi:MULTISPECIES: sulfatase [Haloarcula]|uniref:sulfatase n=1 Tax=Haloarcula TaxID=2237 RepID=UPI0023EAA454|nr:sulfatase [Halomicroarcula sp. XH51]
MVDPVVLLTVDSLTAGHMGCLGYDRNTTPRLDELRRRGTLYTNAVAQSSHTRESMPSLFFSQYPSQLPDIGPVPDDRETIATVLSDSGFTTAGFHSNPYLSRAYEFDKGFDVFDDSLSLAQNRLVTFFHRVVNHFRTEPYTRAGDLNERALEWLDSEPNRPRFCWVHYMDPHGPYQPPASFQSHFTDKSIGKRSAKRLWRQMVDNPSSLNAEDRELLVDLYDAEIRYTDAMIGEFIDGLADRGLLSDALVIVAADHGEAFGQHDVYGHPRHPYEELIHVPLFVLGGGYPADQRVDQPVENLDIGPTILNCSGCSVPPTFSGEALPRESSEYTDVAPVGIAECRGENDARDTRRVAARSARYNYRIELDDEDHVQTSGLYDRQSDDPKRDVSDDAPDVRAHFDDQIREHNDSIQNARVTAGEEIESEAVSQRLRDLGYK